MRLSLSLCMAVALAIPAPSYAEILDNSFFIEEAYNQESRVVQHIQTFHWSREWEGGTTDRSFAYSLTQEWPVAGQRHQLSYTVPYERISGAPGRADGIGDIQVHYRNQVMMDAGGRPAIAPRFTVILPTGSSEDGLGIGTAGFQFNLPISKQLDPIHLHVNAGTTFIPDATVTLPSGPESPSRDLVSVHFGFSVIALATERLHVLFETLSAVDEEIDALGETERTSRVLLSPGMRYGIDRKDGAQWVLGAAAPIGVSDSEDDFGVFLYLSFEHAY